MKKIVFFILCLFFPLLTNATEITHLVVFGDSLSDRGYTQYGGFNRYSNGDVWPDYLAKYLCRDCLRDYAWGGARTDYGNFNGLNWSGILWQIERYKLVTNPDKTLYIIWAGGNDLIDGKGDPLKAANNINLAVKKLIRKGAKHIAIFTIPDFSLVPAYNNKKLSWYKTFAPVKAIVHEQIIAYNKMLKKNIRPTPQANLYLIDFSHFFNELMSSHAYQNTSDPWYGTYRYPETNGYMWWDAWHPMTNVHERIAEYAQKEFTKKEIKFRKCNENHML